MGIQNVINSWYVVFLIGGLLGASSWAISSIFFGVFEPFDSSAALCLGQLFLCLYMFYLGRSVGIRKVLFSLFSMYLGINLYAYMFADHNQRLWWQLLLFTSLFLCFWPAVVGWLSWFYKKDKDENSD